jgi:hypothetical protein
MAAGDLCKVSRKYYCHWFIEGHDNTAIHFSGTPTDKVAASVKVSSIDEVVNGGEKEVVLEADPAKAHSIVERALRQVGRKGYHLAFNNCEHFAKYCATGYRTSAQFNRAVVVSLLCMLAGLSGGVAGVLFGAIQGPVAEAASTYLEHHTRRLRDRPEYLFLLIITFVVMLVILFKQRQKLSLQLQS